MAAGFLRFDSKGYSRVVCCHEAKTGRILWENRDAGYSRLKGIQVHVAIDSAGDVIVTSHKPPSLHAMEATVAKLAGLTGKKQCFRLVRTPSGKTVMARDPNDKNPMDPIPHWQLLGGR